MTYGQDSPAHPTMRRRSAVLWFAWGVVTLLIIPPGLGSPMAAASPWRPHSSQVVQDVVGKGERALGAASATLAQGRGPAGGSPMRCVSEGVAAARCAVARTFPYASTTSPPEQWIPTGGTPTPPAGDSITLVYDAADRYVVLVGNGETWKYTGLDWSQLNLSIQPFARVGSGMVYDPALGEVLLFGGSNQRWVATGGNFVFYNDTWLFSSGRWVRWNGTHSPPAARETELTYDSEDGYALLLDGNGTAGTWAFTSTGWYKISVHGATGPTPRYRALFLDDPRDGYLLLFGGAGCDAAVECRDTWSYRGGYWVDRTATVGTSPSARDSATAFYDATDGYILLYGGLVSGQGGPAPADAWMFSAGRWSQVNSSLVTQFPLIRWGGGATYEAAQNDVMVYGGSSITGYPLADLWTYRGGDWSYLAEGATPPPLNCNGGADSFPMAYDAKDGYVVLVDNPACRTPSWPGTVNGTWRFSASEWSWWPSATVPPSLFGGSMVWDAADDYLVLFGGISASFGYLSGTWTYADGEWTDRTKAGALAPPARDSAAMAYDPWDQYVVLFGGENSSVWGIGFNDTWTYRGGNWTLLSPTGAAPTDRWGAGLAIDPRDDGLLLFGGTTGCPDICNDWIFYNDTWLFRSGNWTLLSNESLPTGRVPGLLSTDPTTDSVLLFGGGGMYATAFNDTWEYSGGNWTEWNTSSLRPPQFARAGTTDMGDREVLIFGGRDYNSFPYNYYGDTWEFQGTPFESKIRATPSIATAPSVVNLSVTASGGTSPFSYNWSFGDGGSATGAASVIHTFLGPGDYLATVNVTDARGNWSRASRTVQVQSNLTVEILSFPSSGGVPLSVSLRALASGGTGSYQYAWSFGDGGQTAGSPLTNYSYESAGTYRAVVQVLDSANDSASAGAEILVLPGPMTAALTVDRTAIDAGQSVNFSLVVGGGVSPYSINYSGLPTACLVPGLGAFECTFPQPGVYLITVLVKDVTGLNATVASAAVTVNPPLVVDLAVFPVPAFTLAVTLVATFAGGTSPFSFYYDYGDGTSSVSNLSSTVHVYAQPGFENATVAVKDAAGVNRSATEEFDLAAPVKPFAATLLPSPSMSEVARPWTISATIVGGYSPYAYSWTGLPRGCMPVNSPTLNCTPVESGSFDVAVMVKDSGPDWTSASAAVTIMPGLDVSIGGATTLGGCGSPMTWVLSAQANGGWAPYHYLWDLGNGGTYQPNSSAFVTTNVGPTVHLTVTDAAGAVANASIQPDLNASCPAQNANVLPVTTWILIGAGVAALAVAISVVVWRLRRRA